MRQLKEHAINLGIPRGETRPLLRDWYVFGHPSVAEGLLTWSQKMPPTSTYERHTNWGLTLTAVANGDNPSILLMLDRKKLHAFMAGFGPIGLMSFIDYGISLGGPVNKERGALMGHQAHMSIFINQGDEHVPLYVFEPAGSLEEEPKEPILLGGILVGESGFNLLDAAELEREVARVRAEAGEPVEMEVAEEEEPERGPEDYVVLVADDKA